jgi:uncharacterized protein YbjQ (UPF0145 family)
MTGGPAVDMPTSTTFELPGYTVERTLGLSWGLIVRSVGLTKGLTGTVRSLKAGEVKEFTEVVDRARHTALERLIDHARQLGGNAVLGVRFDSRTSATAWPRSSPMAPLLPSGQPEPRPARPGGIPPVHRLSGGA